MRLGKRLWAVLLAGVLAVGLLVGFGDGDEAVAKEPRATLGKIMVPAGAFTPSSDSENYTRSGFFLAVNSSTGGFIAPLWFPVPEVYIRKIMLIAYDNTGDINKICVSLNRAEPLKANSSWAGEVCTADSPDNPQKVAVTALNPRRVNTVNQSFYLGATIDPGTFLYGVQVVYSY